MGVGGKRHATAALPQEWSSTPCIGGCLAFNSYHIATWTDTHNNILTDQYNGFVTPKDFELPDDGFDWGAETCLSDLSVINYPELICAFCWFIFVLIM